MCETFNRKILQYMDKPIVTMLKGIKHYPTKRIISKKKLMNNHTGNIYLRIELLLKKNKKLIENWTPT